MRTTSIFMPIWKKIKETNIFSNPFFSGLVSHHYYELKNKDYLGNIYGKFPEEEQIMPSSFMNPIHMRLKKYGIENNGTEMDPLKEIERQIKGGDPKIVESNVFNQSDFFVPEKYSPRGPWNELSLKNGSQSIGSNLTVFKGRQKYSDWKKPESFYIGVNERDDWIFWAKIASIIDYKPPLHSKEQNNADWWLDRDGGKINRVELSWNDLLQQLPGFLPTLTESVPNSPPKLNIPDFININTQNRDDIDNTFIIDCYENYIDYIIPDNIFKQDDSTENKELNSYKKALFYRNFLTDAAWKLFKNGKGLRKKMEMDKLKDISDDTEKKNKFKEILRDSISRIPGLFDGNGEKHTNILINKWYPYKMQMWLHFIHQY